MNLETNPYFQDILSQPEALRLALKRFDPSPLEAIRRSIQKGEIERWVLTGMGASLYAALPAWLLLVQAGLPAWWIDTSELLHYAGDLITGNTLLWVFSQSGRSAEIVALLERFQGKPRHLLALVNDLESPLAEAAGERVIPLWAEPEYSVSTRTYLNSLALAQLATFTLRGIPLENAFGELKYTADAIEAYLNHWQQHLEHIQMLLASPQRLVLLGRGSSLSAVHAGSLILGEAAKTSAMGFQAGQFRHGPLELADGHLTALLFAGPAPTRPLMERLHHTLKEYGAFPVWIAPLEEPSPSPHLPMPSALGVGTPLGEIVPIQLLTLHMASLQGVVAGQFRHIGKVTLQE